MMDVEDNNNNIEESKIRISVHERAGIEFPPGPILEQLCNNNGRTTKKKASIYVAGFVQQMIQKIADGILAEIKPKQKTMQHKHLQMALSKNTIDIGAFIDDIKVSVPIKGRVPNYACVKGIRKRTKRKNSKNEEEEQGSSPLPKPKSPIRRTRKK